MPIRRLLLLRRRSVRSARLSSMTGGILRREKGEISRKTDLIICSGVCECVCVCYLAQEHLSPGSDQRGHTPATCVRSAALRNVGEKDVSGGLRAANAGTDHGKEVCGGRRRSPRSTGRSQLNFAVRLPDRSALQQPAALSPPPAPNYSQPIPAVGGEFRARDVLML